VETTNPQLVLYKKDDVLKTTIKGIEENIIFHVERDKEVGLLIFIILSNSE
jgi:hypothetical protein